MISSAGAGRGIKRVGEFLPYRRNIRPGHGIAVIGQPHVPATVGDPARRTGTPVTHVDPFRDDLPAAIAAAEIVAGPPNGIVEAFARAWKRPYVRLGPVGSAQRPDAGAAPGTGADSLAGSLAEAGADVRLPGPEGPDWPGAGPRVARQLRQLVFIPF
jgi:hypothetical protein